METKILSGILIMAVLLIGTAMAHENFNETKELIDSNISCDKLTNEQLEEIGDYYMEQMHPGEAHELMHDMMGGEDSETVKLMHINMAKGIYCGEDIDMMSMMGGNMMSGGMMGGGMMGNNMMSSGMMSGGMMGNNMMSSGMTGNQSYYKYWNFVNVLYIALLIGLIILVYILIKKTSL